MENAASLAPRPHFEQHDDERKKHDGHGNPSDDHPPARTKRRAAAIAARKADGPYFYAALREHAAVAANGPSALSTRPNGLHTAVLAASNGAAAAIRKHQAAGHPERVAHEGALA